MFCRIGEHRYYHSILKNGKCVMAHPSDLAPALIALNSKAVILGPVGERTVPMEEFFVGPDHDSETVLKTEEFLTEVRIPIPKGRISQIFLKERIRRSADFALSSVAMVAQISDGICEDIRIVLGGVAPFPYVASAAEEMAVGKKMDEGSISRTADAAVEGARPLRMNHYKVDLTRALVRRALGSMWKP